MSARHVIPMDVVPEALKEGYTVRMEGKHIMAWKDLPGLTPQMLACLEFIQEATKHTTVSPSYDEICVALDIRSKSNVHRMIRALVDRGYIVDQPYCARSLRLTAEGEEALAA